MDAEVKSMDDGDNDIFEGLIKRIDYERSRPKEHTAMDDLMLDISRASLVFLRSDHQRVAVMWAWFRPFAVLAGAAALAIIGAAVTGHIGITITP